MSTYRKRPQSRYRRAVKVVWYKDFTLLVKLLPPVFLVVISVVAIFVININNSQLPPIDSGSSGTPQIGAESYSSSSDPDSTESISSEPSDPDDLIKPDDRFGWNLLLVNTEHRSPENYEDTELVTFGSGEMLCDARAKPYIQQMLADAKEDGYNLYVLSTYRSIAKQTELFDKKVKSIMNNQHLDRPEAEKEAAKTVAYPGTSEHNIGLAFDIACDGHFDLTETFAQTQEFQWLEQHCTDYGFVIRFERDKTAMTGINYEPWHYRYVGKKHAKEMKRLDMCLEEYIDYLAGLEGDSSDMPTSSDDLSSDTATNDGNPAA